MSINHRLIKFDLFKKNNTNFYNRIKNLDKIIEKMDYNDKINYPLKKLLDLISIKVIKNNYKSLDGVFNEYILLKNNFIRNLTLLKQLGLSKLLFNKLLSNDGTKIDFLIDFSNHILNMLFFNHIVIMKNCCIYIVKLSKNQKNILDKNKNGYILNNEKNLDKIIKLKERFDYITINYNTHLINNHKKKYLKINSFLLKNDLINHIKSNINDFQYILNYKNKINKLKRVYNYIYQNKIVLLYSKVFLNTLFKKLFEINIESKKFYNTLDIFLKYFKKTNLDIEYLGLYEYYINKLRDYSFNYHIKLIDETKKINLFENKMIIIIKNSKLKDKLNYLKKKENKYFFNLNSNQKMNEIIFFYNKISKKICGLNLNLYENNISIDCYQNINKSIDKFNDYLFNKIKNVNINNEMDLNSYLNEFILLCEKEEENNDYFTDITNEECLICYEDELKEKIFLKCNEQNVKHIYCYECAQKWFSKNNNCAYCRKEVNIKLENMLSLYETFDMLENLNNINEDIYEEFDGELDGDVDEEYEEYIYENNNYIDYVDW
jgi:hypothetical protein